jgi:uncharacterized protein (DUF1015 family)
MPQPATPPPAELRLLPFRAVRFTATADLADLVCPPYDVIDDEQRRTLLARHPHNVVRIVLPEPGDLDDGREGNEYAHAAALFDTWLADDVLAVDAEAALYVYQQRIDDRVLQRGLLGAVVWQPLDAHVILPHENVRPGPVQDRLALMRAMRANPEPIFLLYEGGGPASDICAVACAGPPLASGRTPDGVTHELWAVRDPAQLTVIDADLATRTAMIADGHHRYTTYGYLRDELGGPDHAPGPWDTGLTLLVDESAGAPDIRAIHRVIPGLAMTEAARRAAEVFDVRPLPDADLTAALRDLAATTGPAYVISDGAMFAVLFAPDDARLAAAKPADRGDAWWRLDASVASVLLMEQLWGRSDTAGQVEAEHEPAAALRLARETAGTALLLKPAPLAGIVAVAEAGEAMPRKSTLFLPKPCSGLVMRAFRFEDEPPTGR